MFTHTASDGARKCVGLRTLLRRWGGALTLQTDDSRRLSRTRAPLRLNSLAWSLTARRGPQHLQQHQQPEGPVLTQSPGGERAAACWAADRSMNSSTSALIASEADLEAFCNQPIEERSLTAPLRGVLAETAVTGVVRYKWALLRPLVEFAMEKVIREYDGQGQDVVGPSRYSSYGETVMQTVDRFKTLLSSFADAPWTLQRLCELVLEPRKQYTQLHKVVLAIEKCLLVTSEVPTSTNPPPMPCLDALANVNSNPPAEHQPAQEATVSEGEGPTPMAAEGTAGAGGVPKVKVREDDSASAAFVGSMIEVRVSVGSVGSGGAGASAGGSGPAPQNGTLGAGSGSGAGATATPTPHRHTPHSGSMEHIEEDHWPENSKAGPGSGLHIVLHHHRDRDNQHHPPAQLNTLPAPHSLLPLLGQQRQVQQPQAAASTSLRGGSPPPPSLGGSPPPPSSRHLNTTPAGTAAASEQLDPCSKGADTGTGSDSGPVQDQAMNDAVVLGVLDEVVGDQGAALKGRAAGPDAVQQTCATGLTTNGMEE